MINKATIIGRMGRDPEIMALSNGGRVAKLALATTEKWTDSRSGEKRERTEWHRIGIFNENLINVVEQYARKGQLVYVEGQLQTREYEKDGVKHYSTEIILGQYGATLKLLDRPDDAAEGPREGGRRDSGRPPTAARPPQRPVARSAPPAQARWDEKERNETRAPAERQPGYDLDDAIPF